MSKTKKSVVLVYTGDGKGKTSAALGQVVRALGAGQRVAFVQFIKSWEVSEHKFFANFLQVPNLQDMQGKFTFYKGGRGFYRAGAQSAKGVSDSEHHKAAEETFDLAYAAAKSGDYDLVICDEINNAVHDGLLNVTQLRNLITHRAATTSLCLTGRNFPAELLDLADIATDMTKLKHHFDDGFLAEEGIDY
jgi:cob(I)alamin adenosyltransferase